MATIRTNENIVNLRLETGETAIVEFQPEGASVDLENPVGFPAGLPELVDLLADRLFCRSEEKDHYDQQLIKRARKVAYDLRKIKHDCWESQFKKA